MIQIHSYTVQAGDTLSAISVKLYGDSNMVWEIAHHNGISNPNKVLAGQVLILATPAKDITRVAVPVTPPPERLEAISNMFRDGFCDEHMAYDIYAAALGVESQYYDSVGAVKV